MADGKGSIALKKEEQRHRFSDRGLSGTSEISAEGILLKEISRNAVHTGSESSRYRLASDRRFSSFVKFPHSKAKAPYVSLGRLSGKFLGSTISFGALRDLHNGLDLEAGGQLPFRGHIQSRKAFGVPVDRPQAGMPVCHARVVAVRCRQLWRDTPQYRFQMIFAKELCPGEPN